MWDPAHAPSEPTYSARASAGLQRALRLGEPGRGAALASVRARWRVPLLHVPQAASRRRWVRPRGAGAPGSCGRAGGGASGRGVVPIASMPGLGPSPGG